MPTPVFPTAYQVEVRGFLFGQFVENVWHVQGPDPFDEGVAGGIAANFSVGYADMMASFSVDWTVSEVHIHNLAGLASGEYTLAITPAQEGSLAASSEPGCVAMCISLRTALDTRRTRGRKYFPGLVKGDVVGNLWSSTRRDNLLSAISTFMGNLTTAGTPLCVFSPTGLTLIPVTAAVATDLNVDAQRRRLTGRGR